MTPNKAASVEEVARLGRPVKYVKASEDKEAIARQIVAEQKIGSGPVCVIKSVEPCWSYDIYRSREEKKLKLVKRPRQCLFLYHYQIPVSYTHLDLSGEEHAFLHASRC